VRAVHAAVGDNRDAILAWSRRAGQNAYAALAPLVFDAAASDPVAADLLDAAARTLGDIALALDPEGDLPLVVSGSVGTRLTARMASQVRARLVEPAGDAVDGALRLIRATLDGGTSA
jgi:glucosamine kinase